MDGGTTTIVFSNEDLNDIMIIVTSLEDADSLIEGVIETVENEVKKQKRGFLGMLAATLSVSSFGNVLTGTAVIRAGKRTIRAGQDF